MKTKVAFLSAILASLLLVSFAVPMTGAIENDIDYGPMAALLPSNGEIFGWIKDLWEIGDQGRYGWRMPGTPAEYEGAKYVFQKFQEFGLDAIMEPVSSYVSLPDELSLTIRVGEKIEEIPCGYVRHSAFTPPEGIAAEMVYVGTGTEAEFEAKDVEGKIALVDVTSTGMPYTGYFEYLSLFTYDPDNTLPGDMVTENYPNTGEETFHRAIEYGAVGYVGILTCFAKWNNQEDMVCSSSSTATPNLPIPGLFLSPDDGEHPRSLLVDGHTVEATIVITGNRGPGVAYNVYGFLPGKTDEIIVVDSHHDGWATNDAAGMAIVMAIAKYFAQFPQESRERTLMFVGFSNHWGIGPSPWNVTGLEEEGCLVYTLLPKMVFANVIEMPGKQFKIIDGEYVETGLICPTGMNINRDFLLPIVSEAIIKYELVRKVVLPAFFGEGGYFSQFLPTVEHISHNPMQFTNDDTPQTVAVDALRPVTAAFIDIITQVDAIPTAQLLP